MFEIKISGEVGMFRKAESEAIKKEGVQWYILATQQVVTTLLNNFIC